MAKPNYGFAKRQRELAKQQKKEEKKRRKEEAAAAQQQPAAAPEAADPGAAPDTPASAGS